MFELLNSEANKGLVLRFLLYFHCGNALKHHLFFFFLSVLVAVVKDKEVFLTTPTETTKDFSFQFFPHLGCTFVFEMEIACCILIVSPVLISDSADVISVSPCCSFQTFCF